VAARISGIRSWISATSSLASVVMIAKVRSHSPEVGSFQFSHSPPILHGNGIGLLGSLTPDRLPFEETIDWEYATPPTIGVPKRRQPVNGLAFGVDRLASALGVLTPVRDETPAQRIE
jgi:hypothetical protein